MLQKCFLISFIIIVISFIVFAEKKYKEKKVSMVFCTPLRPLPRLKPMTPAQFSIFTNNYSNDIALDYECSSQKYTQYQINLMRE